MDRGSIWQNGGSQERLVRWGIGRLLMKDNTKNPPAAQKEDQAGEAWQGYLPQAAEGAK